MWEFDASKYTLAYQATPDDYSAKSWQTSNDKEIRVRQPERGHSEPKSPRDEFRLLLQITSLVLVIIVCNFVFICAIVLGDKLRDVGSGSFDGPPTFRDYVTSDSLIPEQGLNLTELFFEIVNELPPPKRRSQINEFFSFKNCRDLDTIRIQTQVASGWTKSVLQGQTQDGRRVAVKVVASEGHDMSACLMEDTPVLDCYKRSSAKFLRELAFLLRLKNNHIIKLKAFCVPSKDPRLLMIVTELGDPVDLLQLLQTSWEDRLRIARGLTHLLGYMATSPLGSVVLNDFRRQQFVLVDGEIKLSDLDDLSFTEQMCRRHADCAIPLLHSNYSNDPTRRLSTRNRCIQNRCDTWNERSNIARAANQFASYILANGYPPGLANDVTKFKELFESKWARADHLTSSIDRIVLKYTSGQYLSPGNRTVTDYVHIPDHDLSPLEEIEGCHFVPDGHGCRIPVFDTGEAADYCSSSEECSGFVLMKEISWSGHRIVQLKRRTEGAVPTPWPARGRQLFLKKSQSPREFSGRS